MTTRKLSFTRSELDHAFPVNAKIRQPRPIQTDAMEALVEGMYLQELPTGTGKTPLEYMILQAGLRKIAEDEHVFWIFPTKALVDQVKREFPDVNVILGQNEHACLWAAENFEQEPEKSVTQDLLRVLTDNPNVPRVSEIPRSMCRRCRHHVDQETGETQVKGVVPCQYFQQTYEAKRRGGIIAATMSYYIFAKMFGRAFSNVAVLVIDEVHRLADVIRYTLSYDITDWHLKNCIELLEGIEAPERASLKKFLRTLKGIVKSRKRGPRKEYLLSGPEIQRLIDILNEVDPDVLFERISQATASGKINPKKDWKTLRKLETLVRDITRYVRAFEFSLAEEDEEGNITRRPLNYSCSYYKEEIAEEERVQHKLVIHCHYVVPLVRKCLLAPTTVSFSATIGRPNLFAFECGIREELFSAPSTFPITNRRIYLPADADDLGRKFDPAGRKKTRTLRQIARGCNHLAQSGIRSLVLVISDAERQKFMQMAAEEDIAALTYGKEVSPKDIAGAFRSGEGQVLCGCIAHFGMGVDFPKGTAGAIWFLRPGYPDPTSAATQFELERYTNMYWSRLIYRVMLEAQQAMGRNIRGPRDKGVCFLMSQQFTDFVYKGLPEWLKPAYRRGKMLEECVDDAVSLLSS